MRLVSVVLTIAATALAAHAALVTVTINNGTFGPSTQSNSYFAPNASWTASFQVESQPVVSGSDSWRFGTHYVNGTYALNGSNVPLTATGTNVGFASDYNMIVSMFALDSESFMQIYGSPYMFSGPTSNPQMLPGVYSVSTIVTDAPVGGINTEVYYSPTNMTITVSGTPEPASWGLFAAGLILLPLLRIRRSRLAR